jgi:hypothetical protein
MKTKKFFMVLVALLITGMSMAQMNSLVMPPFSMDVTSSPLTVNSLYTGAPSSGSYYVSNGVYDRNGNLLFFVKDNNIYAGNGSLVGPLGTNPSNSFLGGEIAIVPIPGECKKFFVIYSLAHGPLTGAIMAFVKVDCTGATPSIIYSTGTQAFVIANTGSNGNLLAVSKRVGSGATAVYHLYFLTGGGGVFHSTISNTGISAGTLIHTSSVGGLGTEMEISENGLWLAFNNLSYVPVTIQLSNPTTYLAGSEKVHSYASTFGRICGLEFVGSGSVPDLYVAGETSPNGGPFLPIFDRINLTTLARTSLNISPYVWKNTHIEYTKSGQMVGIANSGGNRYLVEYNITSGAVNATNINNVNPHASNLSNSCVNMNGMHSLPDQIDGENYSNFTSFPIVSLSSLLVNGQPAPFNGCNGQWLEVYNCNPIFLSATFEGGTPCYMELSIYAHDEYCNPLPGNGPTWYNYGAVMPAVSYAPGYFPDYDMRDHYSDYENSLYTMPGYYVIAMTILDCCGQESTLYYPIRVLQSIAPNLNLQIYDNSGANPSNPWLSASGNAASPTNVGSSSLAYQVGGSTGNITGYTALIEEVDNMGNVIGAGTIYNKTINTTNIVGIGSQNLNALCVPASVWPSNPGFGSCTSSSPAYSGYTGYFAYTNGLYSYGKEYRITVTLLNPCSNATKVAYIYVASQNNRMAATGIANTMGVNTGVSIYPNPAAEEMEIKISNAPTAVYQISLFDVNGKQVKTLTTNINPEEGDHSLKVNVRDLPAGVYSWNVSSEYLTRNGKISVVK